MSFDLGKLFIDWRRIVPNGIPNPNNDYHLVLLKEICLARGIDEDVVNNVMLTLEKDGEDEKYVSIGYGKYKLKKDIGPDGKGKEGTPSFTKDDSGNYVKTGEDDDKKDTDDGEEEKEEPKASGMSTDDYAANALTSEPDADDVGAKDGKEKPKSKEELISSDHKTVEEALRYTKSQSKQDKASGGRKGVGLGTDVSRAGEAAVHTGLRMLQNGVSFEKIEEDLMKIADEKDTYLNTKWVKASISTLKAIDEKIGVKDIKDVAWDTPEGRTAIGVDPKLKTSSDMFVRTKDGKNIGVSLKQDGSVFLNNGGWGKQSGLLLDKLKDVMPSGEHEALSEAMSIKGYQKDRADKYNEVTQNYTSEDIIKMTNELTPEERKKTGLSDKYIKELKDAEKLLEDSRKGIVDGKPALSENQMKAIARLLSIKDKEKEQIIRQSDTTLTDKTFAVLNSSEAAKNGMNRHVLKSMHVFDALGLNKDLKEGGVDGFITMYGIPPDGATLDEGSIVDLFGSEFQQILAENLNEVRNGDREPKELEEIMAKKIEINYESGEILFKHENEMKYPLFYLSGRARGLGSSPVMELGQTSFMALALKVGSFDTDKWTPEQKKKLSDELKKEAEERLAKRMEED